MKVQGLFLVAIFCLSYTQLVKGQTLLGCPRTCGNVTLEYPFGFSPGCFHAEDNSFNLTCKKEKLLFHGLEVVNISHNSQLRVLIPPSYSCFNSQGGFAKGVSYYVDNDRLGSSLTLSDNNRLTAVGCNTYAFLTTVGKRQNSVGCISVCDAPPLVTNRECNGEGCCQNPVPAGSNWFIVRSSRFTTTTSNGTFVRPFSSSCIYAFLIENGTFKFNAMENFTYLQTARFPVVLDWSIVGERCKLCSVNSICSNSTGRTGYVCKCEKGFEGNPYLLIGGCQGTSY